MVTNRKYSADWLKEHVRSNQYTGFNIRNCGLCRSPLNYRFQEECVYFDSNCNCVTYTTRWTLRSYMELEEVFNACPSEEQREDLLSLFWN